MAPAPADRGLTAPSGCARPAAVRPSFVTRFGYTLMTEQSGPQGAGPIRHRRRGARASTSRCPATTTPLAERAGPRAVRLDVAGRSRAGDRPGRAHDLRHLPDHALPPGGGRAEGRDPGAARRRAVHCSASARARTSTSTSSGKAGRPSGPAGHARRGGRDHPRAAHGRPGRLSAASTSRSTRPGSGTSRTSRCRSASRCRGPDSIDALRAARRPPGRGRARRGPGARAGTTARRAPDRRRPASIGQIPICWDPDRGRRDRSGRTSSSAGSAAAGRSTPTCRRPAGFDGASQFVRPDDVADVDPVRSRPGRDRRGRRGLLGGRLHRRRARAGRRRHPGRIPGDGRRAAPGHASRRGTPRLSAHPARTQPGPTGHDPARRSDRPSAVPRRALTRGCGQSPPLETPRIQRRVRALCTALPSPSLLKYTRTSRPASAHSRTRSAHQRRSSSE